MDDSVRVGVDVGGTFTDVVVVGPGEGDPRS
jgi:N-methylhydantoinase A/oxoprolinase/acetone carboxylase beta subunit